MLYIYTCWQHTLFTHSHCFFITLTPVRTQRPLANWKKRLSPQSFDTFRRRQVTPRCPPTPPLSPDPPSPRTTDEAREEADGWRQDQGGPQGVTTSSLLVWLLLFMCLGVCVCVYSYTCGSLHTFDTHAHTHRWLCESVFLTAAN